MIEFEHVFKTYEKSSRALRDVSFQIDDGEFVFVTGRSGSGKTTIVRLLLREIAATEGRVLVDGQDLAQLRQKEIPFYRRRLGVVFQDFRLLKDATVFENVAFAKRVTGASKAEIAAEVPKVLERVGLAAKYKAYPGQLSGGEQQRVAIARAIVNAPEILIADEPTGNLDPANSWHIMKLLEDINAAGTTVVVVTHSRELIEGMNKRVIQIHRGAVRSDGPWDPAAEEEEIRARRAEKRPPRTGMRRPVGKRPPGTEKTEARARIDFPEETGDAAREQASSVGVTAEVIGVMDEIEALTLDELSGEAQAAPAAGTSAGKTVSPAGKTVSAAEAGEVTK